MAGNLLSETTGILGGRRRDPGELGIPSRNPAERKHKRLQDAARCSEIPTP